MILQLRPGASGKLLLRYLQEEAELVGNVRGGSHSSASQLDAYRAWANNAAERLGQVVSRDDLDRLVTTQRYWALQVAGAEQGNLGGLVRLELEERLRDFTAARDRLERELRRWAFDRGPGVYVVADTNFYLHHQQYFDEADWHSFGPPEIGTDDVRLVVPLVVVDELDRQKRFGQGRVDDGDTNSESVRVRARKTLERLNDLFRKTGTYMLLEERPADYSRGAVTAALLVDDPQRDRLPINDDEIVDEARGLRDLTELPVYIATSDTGMALRIRNAGLKQWLPWQGF